MRITVNIDDRVYQIRFRHFRDIQTKQPYATTCHIEDGKTGDELFEGRALCSDNDNFSYEVGRKIAMARALIPIERKKRIYFWNAYFGRFIKELLRPEFRNKALPPAQVS